MYIINFLNTQVLSLYKIIYLSGGFYAIRSTSFFESPTVFLEVLLSITLCKGNTLLVP